MNDARAMKERITRNPRILLGKPTIRGTRISVELVLDHLSGNLDLDDLFAAYPELTIEDVKAVLAYASQVVGEAARAEATAHAAQA
jgi:uncharacterized protein (DUF433 family)